MTGPNHSIICFLTGAGHGAAAWITHSSDETSYLARTSSGSLSMRMNIVGTTWLWVTWYCSIEREVLLGVEVLHHHDGAAERLRSHAEAQRSGVVERRRRQVHLGVVDGEQQSGDRPSTPDAASSIGVGGERQRDALRAAGRAGRVEHVGAGDPLVERVGRLRGDGGLVALVAVDRAVEHQAQLDAGRVGDDLGGLVGLVLRGDEDLRLAVVDDVLELAALQPRRHAGVDRAGVVAAPHHLEVAVVVLHAERDVVARLHPGRPEQMAEAVGRRVEFGEGLGEAGTAHDEGGLVGVAREMCTGEHVAERSRPIPCSPCRHGSPD